MCIRDRARIRAEQDAMWEARTAELVKTHESTMAMKQRSIDHYDKMLNGLAKVVLTGKDSDVMAFLREPEHVHLVHRYAKHLLEPVAPKAPSPTPSPQKDQARPGPSRSSDGHGR